MKQRSTPHTNHTALSGTQGNYEQVAALTSLQRLFSQYSAVVERAKEGISSPESLQEATWSAEAEVLLETVEAYLRARRQEGLLGPPVRFTTVSSFTLQKSFITREKMFFKHFLSQITAFITDTRTEVHDVERLQCPLLRGKR